MSVLARRAACFVRRTYPELLGWSAIVVLLVAVALDGTDETWFVITLGVLLVAMAAPPTVEGLRDWAEHRAIPDLAEMAYAQQHDHTSGVWMIAPPYGAETWDLYAPGQAHPDAHYPHADVHPLAVFSALQGPGYENPAGPAQTLDQIREWAVPWVELVSGGTVVDIRQGWGLPYGPLRDTRECEVFVVVKPPDQAFSS